MQDATASYWMVIPAADGTPAAFLWNCEACPGMGVVADEPGTIAAMNEHMATKHKKSTYVPAAVPE